MKKLENKQFTTDLINHNKKRIAYFEGGRKRKHKNNTTLKALAKTASLSITYQKKKKRKPKKANDKKTIKGPTLKMKMITMT